MSDRGDINQKWTMEGADEFTRSLRAIATEAEKTAATLKNSSLEASVGINALNTATTGLQAAFRTLGGFAGEAAGPFSKILGAVTSLTTGFAGFATAIGGVTAGLFALGKQGANAADEVRDGSIRIGTSAQNYSAFQFALEQSGARAQGFERAMGVLQQAASTAEDAAKQTDTSADLFKGAAQKFTEGQKQITDLFAKKNLELLDEARRSAQEIADLTRKRGTAEEEARLQSTRRVEDIERQHTRALNDLITKRNAELQAGVAESNRKIEEAAQKAADGADKFSKFGVSLLTATGKARDPTEILTDIAAKFEDIPDPASRAAKAIDLFGRRQGPQLVEFLSLGRAGIADLILEAKRLGITFNDEAVTAGDAFNDSLNKLTGTIARTSQKIGLLFDPAFTAIMEAMAAAFGQLQEPILAALKPIADDFKNIFTGNLKDVQSQFLLAMVEVAKGVGVAFKALGVVVMSVLTVMGEGFKWVGDLFNTIFGTKLTTVDIVAFIAAMKLAATAIGIVTTATRALTVAALANPWVALATGIAVAASVIITNWEPISAFFTKLWADLVAGATAVGQSVAKGLSDLDAATRKIFTDMGTWVSDTFWAMVKSISDAFTWAWNWIKGTFIDPVLQAFQWIIDKANEVAEVIKKAFSLVTGGGGTAPATPAPGPQVQGAARGGLVRGRGTGTSDSNLRRVSDGEYIVNALATRAFLPLLEAINRGLAPRGTGFAGFALGGLAGSGVADRSLLPRSSVRSPRAPLAAAGGGHPLTLVLDGRSFGGMTATDDAVGELVQFARQTKMRSLGAKPSYYGNG